jgi:tRNA pseudouridine38-40 synthase
MHYRLTIQYDGTDFHGWQAQSGRRTVQGELERALTLIEGAPVALQGAGRTDAGVHAEGQVACARLRREFEPERLRAAINGNIAGDVRVIEAALAPDEFHARFSARGKTYRYSIFNEHFQSPFWLRYALHEARRLDVRAMIEAAAQFVGEHDWTAFSAAQAEARTRVRRVTRLDITERWCERGHGRVIEIHAGGEGFLRYMVRSMAGGLLAVGRGELRAEDLGRAIETGERLRQITTAPAHGLTLVKVDY